MPSPTQPSIRSQGDRGDITELLRRVQGDDRGALGALWQAAYAEIHSMATAAYARESDLPTLQPTALVSEVFLRLYPEGTAPIFENRRHFFGAVARALGQVLVDHARSKRRLKRGGEHRGRRLIVTEHELADADELDVKELEKLMVAIERLEAEHPRVAEVIWLRFVAGLSDSEVAGLLGVSRRTVQSDWLFGKAMLRRELDTRSGTRAREERPLPRED
ncbi:MAG: ECF-type sigma factor [Phycisphaerales bacterium]